MNKYIAFAALLAAGTLGANAAEAVLTTTFSNAAQSTATSVTVTNDPSSVSASITSLVDGDNSDLSLQTSGNAGTDATSVTPNVNVGTGGSWTLTLSYTVGSDSLTISGVTLDVGLFSSSGSWQGSSTSAYAFVRYFDLTLTISSGSTTLATYSVTDEAIGNSDSSAAVVNSTNEVILLGDTEITLDANTIYTVTLSASQGSSNNSLGCYVAVNSITYTIPEPSAFGILAGTGALALVAARRRRTKKA